MSLDTDVPATPVVAWETPRRGLWGRRKLKTGRGGGRAARHTQGSVRAVASVCLPRQSLRKPSPEPPASSHMPDTWELNLSGWKSLMVKSAQRQRSLCQEPTGRDLNSSCEKQNGCFPSLLESYADRRQAGVCPFASFHLFSQLALKPQSKKGHSYHGI